MAKKTHEVFGVSAEVLPDSYVDRGKLDEQLRGLISRNKKHVALRGASKCGKSWLRRKIVTNPIVVQCRLGKSVTDIYADALSQLGIELTVQSVTKSAFKGSVKASVGAGSELLGKAGIEALSEQSSGQDVTRSKVGGDINDLRYVAEILKASGRKLVIEDFHYLSIDQRSNFAFDLKSFWDWGLNVIIIGVWSQDNMLLSLNADLAGRIEEISVTWTSADLERILQQGGAALNIVFEQPLRSKIAEASYGNAGILQTLALQILDDVRIDEYVPAGVDLADESLLTAAAVQFAVQLNPLYLAFGRNVSEGIRSRPNSTGMYAHIMAVVMDASDDDLINGLAVGEIFRIAHSRQGRIQIGNMKSALAKIESLQVDADGRGLVLTYNPSTERVSVVDRQLLLFRAYRTASWPWEAIIEESADDPSAFEGDN